MNLLRKVKAGLYAVTYDGRAFELRREHAGTRNRQWMLYEVSTPEHKLDRHRLIDSGIHTIAEGEKAVQFVSFVNFTLQALDAEERGPYMWTLETRLGPLYIQTGSYHIHMRFENVDRAKAELGGWGNFNHFNPHSGKWNMRWDRGTSNDTMLRHFVERIDRVVTT